MAAMPESMRRRLLLLLAVVVAASLGVAALHHYRQGEQARQVQEYRATAMLAYKTGDYLLALDQFDRYLAEVDDDADALYRRARAQLAVEPGNADAIRRAVANLRRVRELAPDHPTAAHELLELLHQIGEADASRRLAERLIEDDGDDLVAARAYVASLMQLDQLRDAQRAAAAFLRHHGDDWRLHLLTVDLSARQGDAAEAVLERADALRQAHADEPGYLLVAARAHQLADQPKEASRRLHQLVEVEPADGLFARLVLTMLDALAMFDTSLAYLQRWSDVLDDDAMRRELAWRLFERGRFDDLARQFAAFEPGDDRLDADRLALWALALHQRGDADTARQIAAALAQRENDRHARAWVIVLQAPAPDDASRAGQARRELTDALREASKPFFLSLLADAYHTAGEVEFALDLWQEVGQARPTWATPYLRQARLQLELDRPEAALRAGRAALQREPGSVAAAALLGRAWRAHLDKAGRDDHGALIAYLDEVQQVAPGEPRTARLKFELLVEQGQADEAVRWARSLPERQAFARDGEAMLRLARLLREHDAGAADAIYRRYEQQHGSTAALALVRAMDRAAAGDEAAGLALLAGTRSDIRRAAVGRTSDDDHDGADLAWQLAEARYLAAIAHSDAGRAWAELADAQPDHVGVQRELIATQSAWGQREAVDRAIDRLRDAMGATSLTWRVARARWLLEDEHPEQHAGLIVTLTHHVREHAPHRIEPRLLLAQAHQLAGSPALALRELQDAAALAPRSAELRLALAALQREQGRLASARRELRELVDDEHTAGEHRQFATDMLEAIDAEQRERDDQSDRDDESEDDDQPEHDAEDDEQPGDR